MDVQVEGSFGLILEYNKLKETLDIIIPRNTSDASITLTMTGDEAKQLYESLQKALKENDLI
jgi:phosphotransferase system HPr-like phosphotransfer protein